MISKNQIKFVKQLEMKKYRQREGLFVAEGPKVVGDLLTAGYIPHTLFATEEWIQHQHSQNSQLSQQSQDSQQPQTSQFSQNSQ